MGSSIWQLQEAKNRLSEVVDRARAEGPQIVTRRGRKTAVVLSFEDFTRLTRPDTTLVEFLAASPLRDVELDLERPADLAREVDL